MVSDSALATLAAASHSTSTVVFVQAILYGVFLATLARCLQCLLLYGDESDNQGQCEGNNRRKVDRWIVLAVLVQVFVLETMDLGVRLALVIAAPASGNMAPEFWAKLHTIIESMTVLFADAALVYRLWQVYNNSWRIIFLPLLMWLSCLACPILVTSCYSPVLHPTQSRFWMVPPLLYTAFIFFGCHIASNIYTTAALVYKIRCTRCNGSRFLYMTARILTGSGILYTLSSASTLLAHVAATDHPMSHFYQTLLRAVNIIAAGISFNLVLIHIVRERSKSDAVADSCRNENKGNSS